MSSPKQRGPPPVPSPSNPVLIARQSQWIFTDSELYRTPSVLDGMEIETEHMLRSKGVNFVTQVGVLLKLPQLTLSTASVYLHRFFMRHSMVDLPQRQGIHPYSIAATSLFLATKVEENCRKMKELIVACCRVALKQPSLVVDEQSKEFWKWRDTILHNEDLLLEALCFDLQLEQPYRLLYDFLCYFQMQDDKRLRNAAWAFVNDSTFSVLCVQFHARAIAAAALYAAARHCEAVFEDDSLGRPWWEQIDADLSEIRRACSRMAELYEKYPLPKRGLKYPASPSGGELEREAAEKTRQTNRRRTAAEDDINHASLSARTSMSASQSPGDSAGQKREHREIFQTSSLPNNSSTTTTNGAGSAKQTQTHDVDRERSPKRQRRQTIDYDNEGGSYAELNSSSSSWQTQPTVTSSQLSFVQATAELHMASNQSSQTADGPVRHNEGSTTTATNSSTRPPPPPPPPAEDPDTQRATSTHHTHHDLDISPAQNTTERSAATTSSSSAAAPRPPLRPPEQRPPTTATSRIPAGTRRIPSQQHQSQRVPAAYQPGHSNSQPFRRPPPSTQGNHTQR